MKNLLLITTLLLTIACGKTNTVEVGNNDDTRFSDIENRMLIFVATLETDMIAMQNSINDIYAELDTPVIEVVRPCENSHEVFFRLETGEIVAYFEDGNQRYLSVLEDGSYKTTDNDSCNFQILNGEIVK